MIALICGATTGLIPGSWSQPVQPRLIEGRSSRLAGGVEQAGAQPAPPAGSTDARRSRFRRENGPPIVCAPSLASYHAAIREHVQQGDVVVEVGCALGNTTALLAERGAARVLGVDMARDLSGKGSRPSNAAYRQHASPAEAGLPADVVQLALLDPWDVTAMRDMTEGRQAGSSLRPISRRPRDATHSSFRAPATPRPVHPRAPIARRTVGRWPCCCSTPRPS